MTNVVIDTNILFSALIKSNSSFGSTILMGKHQFYICETTLAEIFNLKEKLLLVSHISPSDLSILYKLLITHVTLYPEKLIMPETWRTAYHLCREIDETDTPQVALALHLDAYLWTGDKRLKLALSAKNFTLFVDPLLTE